MYYILFDSFLVGLRMSRFYLSVVLLSVSLSFTTSALSDDVMTDDKQCVILLHGLARTSHSMEKMELALRDAGYLTANIDYPSRTMKIEDLASLAIDAGLAACQSQAASQIHFVTHSLGGILARYYLSENELGQLGRLVQLAPPNRGSLIAEQFQNQHWFKWLTGPAGQQLGTGEDDIPVMLGAVKYPAGVIAGNAHNPVDNWMAEIIPGEDDGKVAVEQAKLEGMSDFIVLPYSHITIMKQDQVILQTIHFLQHGRFEHPAPRSAQVMSF